MMHLTISLMHSFGPKYTNKHMVETHNKHFVMGVSGGVLAALVTNTRKQIASRRRLPKSLKNLKYNPHPYLNIPINKVSNKFLPFGHCQKIKFYHHIYSWLATKILGSVFNHKKNILGLWHTGMPMSN